MTEISFEPTSHYSVIAIDMHSQQGAFFSIAKLAEIDGYGELVMCLDDDHTFPQTLVHYDCDTFNEAVSYLRDVEEHLEGQRYDIRFYEKHIEGFDGARLVVNLPLEEVAYMEANDLMFCLPTNEDGNLSGQKIDTTLYRTNRS